MGFNRVDRFIQAFQQRQVQFGHLRHHHRLQILMADLQHSAPESIKDLVRLIQQRQNLRITRGRELFFRASVAQDSLCLCKHSIGLLRDSAEPFCVDIPHDKTRCHPHTLRQHPLPPGNINALIQRRIRCGRLGHHRGCEAEAPKRARQKHQNAQNSHEVPTLPVHLGPS